MIPLLDDMINKFLWEDYLSETNTIAAPADIFIPVIFSCFFLVIFYFLFSRNPSRPVHFRKLYENNKLKIFILMLLFDASEVFMKVFKAFIKHFEAPQRSVKIIFSLCPRSERKRLTYTVLITECSA